MRIETFLAEHSMPKEEMRDPHKTYHKKSLQELSRMAAAVPWKRYFAALGARLPRNLVVSQPAFLAQAASAVKKFPLEDWKAYLEWHLANDAAGILSFPFVKENFYFYATTLTGVKHMKPLWRRALSAVNAGLGDALGKLYVKEHFPPEAKRKMDMMVSELFAAYAERIRKLDWMSAATKKKALQKLRAMNRKIGYPKRWRSYAGLRVRPDDYFGNVERSHEWEHRRNMRKIGKRVDREEWYMTPQTVNAYFAPTMNEIVFPAAILQAPFFSPEADDAVNYGATGMTIGHELTHSFDDSGSKFDKRGNIREWWTKADAKRFKAKARVVEKQYGRYEALPGIPVNGKLTLGETIADLGGVAIAYDAYQKHLAKNGRTVIEGFTPEQRFFLGYAQGERDHSRAEYLKTITAVDPHPPHDIRTNGTLTNLPEFYQAFNVRPGDRLYRSPSKRAKIW
jgi:putative endopeptidase